MEGGHLNFKIYMESLEKNKNPTEDKFGNRTLVKERGNRF